MAVDPASSSVTPENPQTWNRYAYALNNPIKYFDPDGRDVDEQGQAIADHAEKSEQISKEQKEDIKEAVSDDKHRTSIISSEAAFAVEDPETGKVSDLKTYDTSNPEEKAAADQEFADIESGTSNRVPIGGHTQSNSEGTSFHITVYAGSQSYSPSDAGVSKEDFATRVFGHEIGHTLGYDEPTIRDRED